METTFLTILLRKWQERVFSIVGVVNLKYVLTDLNLMIDQIIRLTPWENNDKQVRYAIFSTI